MKRATIVGTKMAGLNGAVFELELPNTKIKLNYSAEKLFHMNGMPREDFVPPVSVKLIGKETGDLILEVGIRKLNKLLKQQPNKFLQRPARQRSVQSLKKDKLISRIWLHNKNSEPRTALS